MSVVRRVLGLEITPERRSFAASFLSGIAGLALITLVCFRFRTGLAPPALLDLIVVLLVSQRGNLFASAVLSIVAVASLDYFFVPPIFDFRVADPERAVALALFLTTTLFVTVLTAKLRESAAYFRNFVDHATDGFFLFDDRQILVDVNRRACESLGYSREEMIGMHPRDFDAALDAASIAQIGEQLRGGETVAFETLHRRKDGTVFPVEVRARPFFQHGPRRLLLSLALDITQRKRAEEEHEKLQQMESDLAHVNRLSVMGELAASLAHEILHPIASARNNARAAMRFLERSPANLAEVNEALDCIVGDTDRAKVIVDRMRDHIKKAPPQREPFDLNKAIHEVIGMVRSEISKNKISVRTRMILASDSVEADRVQVQQVVLNLILNAIEAMSLIEDVPRELTISAKQLTTGPILVAVQDSGPGIDPDNLERVFTPFYTTKGSGMGMGLSICRSIIAAHGGRLWAEPNQPRGATFQFTLPADLDAS